MDDFGKYMNEPVKRCCGTCKYHKHEDVDDGWVCVNSESAFCSDWTDYNNFCFEWEGK